MSDMEGRRTDGPPGEFELARLAAEEAERTADAETRRFLGIDEHGKFPPKQIGSVMLQVDTEGIHIIKPEEPDAA